MLPVASSRPPTDIPLTHPETGKPYFWGLDRYVHGGRRTFLCYYSVFSTILLAGPHPCRSPRASQGYCRGASLLPCAARLGSYLSSLLTIPLATRPPRSACSRSVPICLCIRTCPAPPPFIFRSINQFNRPLDYNRTAGSCYSAAGAGVVVFVVDSGCATEHPEFGGRATTLALPGSPFPPAGRDDRGHGSHVAGTVGGINTGVAPAVKIVCVKVNDADGNNVRKDAIAGFDYVATYKKANPETPVILQASFHDDAHTLDMAAERVASTGAIPVVSAGNNRGDACDFSPGNTKHVLTVANQDYDDTLWRSTNTGRCIDVIAPGRRTLSVDYQGGLTTMTGTSMSAPTVSGVVAVLLSATRDAGRLTVADMRAILTAPSAPRVAGYPLAWLNPACPGLTPPAEATATPVPAPTQSPGATRTPSPQAAPTPSHRAAPTQPAVPSPCAPPPPTQPAVQVGPLLPMMPGQP